MHSTRKIFTFLLLFHLNGLLFFRSNSVSAWHVSPFKGIEDKIKDPGLKGFNLYAGSIRKVIEVSNWVKFPKPLTLFTALDETALVNLTKHSLNVRLINPVTVATMTGGIFGNDLFELSKYQFLWQKYSCNVTYNLVGRVYYFNLKYGSYEKALDHHDGIVLIDFPIDTNGDFPNPKFIVFSHLLRTNIKWPGSWVKVLSSFTYTWFVNFPYGSIYHSSVQKLVDEETGKKFTATVINLPLDPRTNYISNEQFMETFGRIEGVSQQSSDSGLFQKDVTSSMERHKGVCVLYIPA